MEFVFTDGAPKAITFVPSRVASKSWKASTRIPLPLQPAATA